MLLKFKDRLKTKDKGSGYESGFIKGAWCDVFFYGELLSWSNSGADNEIWPVAIIKVDKPYCTNPEDFEIKDIEQPIRYVPLDCIIEILH